MKYVKGSFIKMNAIDILLLRHCEAQGQEPSAPLTSRGKAQAEELGRMLPNLPISRIFSSPYVRARDSVLSFAENSGLSVNLDERLIERDLGAQNRDDWRSVLEHSFENIDFRCTNGETSREAIVRARDLIDTVASPQLTLFATHGNLYTLILCSFCPSYGFDYWSRLPNPALTRISYSSGAVPTISHIPFG